MRRNVLLLSISILFILRYSTSLQPNFNNGTRIKITSTLREEPKLIGNTQRFNLSKIKIVTWKYPEYRYGDRLEVVGVVKNNGLEMPDIRKIAVSGPPWLGETGERRGVRAWILELRNRMDLVFRRNLPEPQASLLSGISLGVKSNLPADFYQSLQKTGTMHIVVASGMNVSLVSATILSFLLFFMARKKAVILSIILIWFYVVLAGGEVPVVRAGIMGSVVLLAQVFGRQADALRALLASAAIILFINPTSLNDIGFQLSFAATFGLVLLSSSLSNRLTILPKPLRNDLGQTLSAQILTLPIILLNFGTFSILSPLINILVSWPLVWILRLGLAAGFIGLLIPALGGMLCILTLPLLTYFVKMVELFTLI
jgi:competence protein ComEC